MRTSMLFCSCFTAMTFLLITSCHPGGEPSSKNPAVALPRTSSEAVHSALCYLPPGCWYENWTPGVECGRLVCTCGHPGESCCTDRIAIAELGACLPSYDCSGGTCRKRPVPPHNCNQVYDQCVQNCGAATDVHACTCGCSAQLCSCKGGNNCNTQCRRIPRRINE